MNILKQSLECFGIFLLICLATWIIGYFSQGTFNVSYWSNEVRETVKMILIWGVIVIVILKILIYLFNFLLN